MWISNHLFESSNSVSREYEYDNLSKTVISETVKKNIVRELVCILAATLGLSPVTYGILTSVCINVIKINIKFRPDITKKVYRVYGHNCFTQTF